MLSRLTGEREKGKGGPKLICFKISGHAVFISKTCISLRQNNLSQSDKCGCVPGIIVSMLSKLEAENGHCSGLSFYILWKNRVLNMTMSNICGN